MPGSTQYPELIDNNVELTDGVDIIQADDVNHGYVAIDAIETCIGASGATQANSVDLLAFLEAIIPDMVIAWKDDDTVTVRAGRVYCKNSDSSIRLLRKNTSDTDVTFADIDTGARANSTQYYVWASADASATSVAFKISLSRTTPTGLTKYSLLGGFSTDSDGDIIESSVWSFGGGKVVDVRIATNGDSKSITGGWAIDSSKPQISEGTEYSELTIVHALKKPTNKLIFEVLINASHGIDVYAAAGVFVVGTNDCLAVGQSSHGQTGGQRTPVCVRGMNLPATTDAKDYRIRLSANGGSIDVNGFYGGIWFSSFKITEIEV